MIVSAGSLNGKMENRKFCMEVYVIMQEGEGEGEGGVRVSNVEILVIGAVSVRKPEVDIDG